MVGIKHTEFLTYGDKLYIVHRKIPKRSINENHILDVRDAWHCDTVLKTKNQEEDVYVFLFECPDVEIITETPHPTPIPVPPDQ